MERYREGLRERDEIGGAFDVDASIPRENAEDHSICACTFHGRDTSFHFLELGHGINKVSGAGSNHHENWNPQMFARGAEKRGRRSNSTQMKIVAQLDAISACPLRDRGGFYGCNSNFEQGKSLHGE